MMFDQLEPARIFDPDRARQRVAPYRRRVRVSMRQGLRMETAVREPRA
jgi:hypothetical protein